MSSGSKHMFLYKNANLSSEGQRRKREENGIQIRKQKREQQLSKRRHLNNTVTVEGNVSSTDDASIPAPLKQPLITEEMVLKLYSHNVEDQIRAAKKFRRLLSKVTDTHIDEVVEMGVVPRLVELLQNNESRTLQLEAAWSLTNIVTGTSEQTWTVIIAGAVTIFIELLRSSECEKLQEQAAWALGNIAEDGPESINYLLDNDILTPLLQILLSTTRPHLIRNASWALLNLCPVEEPVTRFYMLKASLPVLVHLLKNEDPFVLGSTCSALSFFCDGGKREIQAIVNAGVCTRLVELLMHEEYVVCGPALRAVGNILEGKDVLQTQVVLDCSALPGLLYLLGSNFRRLRQKACSAISNIVAGSSQHIQAVIDGNIFRALVEIFAKADYKSRREAVLAIANAANVCTTEQLRYLVEIGSIPPLCELLTFRDAKNVEASLDSLAKILKLGEKDAKVNSGNNCYAFIFEECSGLDKVESLLRHENQVIYRKALHIVDNYFHSEEEDAIMSPSVDMGTQEMQFNFPDSSDMPMEEFQF